MPIPQEEVDAAQEHQNQAATDNSNQIRLIAGPGTGKSSTIEQRVLWLLSQGVSPNNIVVVSFTRASAADLESRIHLYCEENDRPDGTIVHVSTLHSLALRALRAAGLLAQYPVDPLVLDDWELENIYDREFGETSGIRSRPRQREIRTHHEAFWSTGQWGPPNYIPPDPEITNRERSSFAAFHRSRAQLYSCVLPGEIVKTCVDNAQAGVIYPADILNINHLIVDEYQDLNPYDQLFIDYLIDHDVNTFIAGDDDQSIYSFRYASPSGIQEFSDKYPNCGQHTLSGCFRCTPEVVNISQTLIEANASPDRIHKDLRSLYGNSVPPNQGNVFRWQFASGRQEASAIAESCQELIASGVNPSKIMILLSNTRALASTITNALSNLDIPIALPKRDPFSSTNLGRFLLTLTRIVINNNDYVSLRTLLGLLSGVGAVTCNNIANDAITNNLNYKNLFYEDLPEGLFSGREQTAIERARNIISTIDVWQADDTLEDRSDKISGLIEDEFSNEELDIWNGIVENLPNQTTIEELRDFLYANDDYEQQKIINGINYRLGNEIEEEEGPQRIRIMTMHGAKGLSAQVVFIPGLEENIFPGSRRRQYPGLLQEAARLLFVSITRARAACILSFSTNRLLYGNFLDQNASRFCTDLGGRFYRREDGLSQEEISNILQSIQNL